MTKIYSNDPFRNLLSQLNKTIAEASKKHFFATVTSVTSTGIGISVDGDNSGVKKYTCNQNVKFLVGDRVLVAKESGTYIIICKVGSPSTIVAKTSAMTQSVGVDTNGGLWTTPASLSVATSSKLGGVMPEAKTAAMTQPVGVDTNGRLWAAPTELDIPVATSLKIGGVKPVSKTSAMTQSVGVDTNGGLWTTPPDTSSGTSPKFDNVQVGTSYYYWNIDENAIVPNTTATSYFHVGSPTYPVQKIYAKEIYLDGEKLTTGGDSSDFSGTEVKMGGSTAYYITCNTSRQLRPSNTSTTYPCYLGTSTYYWHYAYIGSNTAMIGSSTSSKIGFFGTTAVTRQTVSNTATVATLITALKKYGLIA